MGGGKKKSNSNKAALLAQKRKRAEAKASKTANKQAKKRGERADTIEEVLAQLDELQEEYESQYKVTTEVSGTPSRRANATLIPSPVEPNALYLFGGEFFDGQSCHFYQDLYRYAIDKKQWLRIFSPNSPGPRSAHTMVGSPADGGKIWVFGGEFASKNQTTFHHFRDLWCYDIKTSAWERFETRVRPSARSGHRMALFKNFLVLFGGFHDTGIRTTYLSDLWLFDLTEYRWHEVQHRGQDQRPRARSGFSMLSCPEGVVLHGGYCKEYAGKIAKGMPLDDSWLLRLDGVKNGSGFSSADVKWEKKRKVGGFAPSLRSGATMANWSLKHCGVLFGGVFDDEADEEHMSSVFYNDLYTYNIQQGRWNSLNVKTKSKGPSKRRRRKTKPEIAEEAGDRAEDASSASDSDAEDDDLADNMNQLQISAEQSQSKAAAKAAAAQEFEDNLTRPVERYNAMLAVQGKMLFMFGGILERKSQEATLDDLWQLDLTKLDQWVCLKQSEIAWNGLENDSDVDEAAEDEDLSDSDLGEGSENEGLPESEPEEEFYYEKPAKPPTDAALDELRKKAEAFLVMSQDEARSVEDKMSTPLPGENLRTFYERTREFWAGKAYESTNSRGKNLRRDGFQLAEEKYETYKPMLAELEKIQASADLDEGEGVGSAATAAGATGVDSRHRR